MRDSRCGAVVFCNKGSGLKMPLFFVVLIGASLIVFGLGIVARSIDKLTDAVIEHQKQCARYERERDSGPS